MSQHYTIKLFDGRQYVKSHGIQAHTQAQAESISASYLSRQAKELESENLSVILQQVEVGANQSIVVERESYERFQPINVEGLEGIVTIKNTDELILNQYTLSAHGKLLYASKDAEDLHRAFTGVYDKVRYLANPNPMDVPIRVSDYIYMKDLDRYYRMRDYVRARQTMREIVAIAESFYKC